MQGDTGRYREARAEVGLKVAHHSLEVGLRLGLGLGLGLGSMLGLGLGLGVGLGLGLGLVKVVAPGRIRLGRGG